MDFFFKLHFCFSFFVFQFVLCICEDEKKASSSHTFICCRESRHRAPCIPSVASGM